METASYSLTVSEAEQYILAQIINGDDKAAYYVQRLQPESFSDERHRIIWSNILQMMVSTTPVGAVTLKAQLIKARQLELAGGAVYIDELKIITTDVNSLDEYFRIILMHRRSVN